ncbi:energy-coupling factor transporter transmembrane component T [Streptococcus orisratti]
MRYYHSDMRTKILTLLCVNMLLLAHIPIHYESILVVFLCFCLFLEGDRKRAVTYLMLFSFLVFVEEFLVALNQDVSYINLLAVGSRSLLPCFIMGSSILRSSVHEFITCMRTWHIPESLLLAVAVLMRFLPLIKQDYRSIRTALKLRGLYLTPLDLLKHPLAYFEHLVISLLMSMTRTAQELTIASLTKSAGNSGAKTSYITYRFERFDYFILIFLLGLSLSYFLGGVR